MISVTLANGLPPGVGFMVSFIGVATMFGAWYGVAWWSRRRRLRRDTTRLGDRRAPR